MSLQIHVLKGCRPTPLGSYLKSLAVLRLVSEQKDPAARAFWRDDTLHLATSLTAGELRAFFLSEYSPTPVVGPWNGGSGFYEGDARDGMDALLASAEPRFARYRQVLKAVAGWNELPATGRSVAEICDRVLAATEEMSGKSLVAAEELLEAVSVSLPEVQKQGIDARSQTIEQLKELAEAPETPRATSRAVKELLKAARKVRSRLNGLSRAAGKEQLASVARSRLDDQAIRWVDATLLVNAEGEVKYPPLLGSGGNEGRLDYTTGFMGALAAAVVAPLPQSSALLDAALFGTPTAGLVDEAVGQFDPGRAGGFNQGPEAETKIPGSNPWDFILTIEGSLVWSSALTKTGAAGATQLASPFTVRAKAAGYASAAAVDAETARAELWTPLWSRPLGYAELAKLVSDGRAQVGKRSANDALEFARAAGSLGTARGIDSFVRFGLLKRRGDSYVAVPMGRFHPRAVDPGRVALVQGLDPLLRAVDSFIYRLGDHAPKTVEALRRQLDEALFAMIERGEPGDAQRVLAGLGAFEQWLSHQDRLRGEFRSPLGHGATALTPGWLAAADDGSPELRLAAALASIPPRGRLGPLRANLTPVDPERPWAWASGNGQHQWEGRSLPARLAGVFSRRLMDEQRLGVHAGQRGAWRELRASASDVAAFIEGDIDDARFESLLYALTLLDWKKGARLNAAKARRDTRSPSALFALLRLGCGGTLKLRHAATEMVLEPSIVRLLLAGRVAEASRVASRRLRVSGLIPVDVDFGSDPSTSAERLAGALLVPLRLTDDDRLVPWVAQVIRSVELELSVSQ